MEQYINEHNSLSNVRHRKRCPVHCYRLALDLQDITNTAGYVHLTGAYAARRSQCHPVSAFTPPPHSCNWPTRPLMELESD